MKKHIFVFTICVVLSIGVYSEDLSDHANDEKDKYRQTLLQKWMPGNQKNGTIEEDYDGNVYIRIFVQPGANKSDLFIVPNMKRLGVNVTTPTSGEYKTNLEVINYFADLLRVRYFYLEVEDGCTSEFKTLKLQSGYSNIDDVYKIIVDKCIEMKYGGNP